MNCIVCSLRIHPGQRYHRAEFGVVHISKKSGRDIPSEHSNDFMHYECIPDYYCDSKYEPFDAIIDRAREEAKGEMTEELREELYAQIYDQVVDQLGRNCAICDEEIRIMAEPEPETPRQQNWAPLPPNPFNSLPPYPTNNGR